MSKMIKFLETAKSVTGDILTKSNTVADRTIIYMLVHQALSADFEDRTGAIKVVPRNNVFHVLDTTHNSETIVMGINVNDKVILLFDYHNAQIYLCTTDNVKPNTDENQDGNPFVTKDVYLSDLKQIGGYDNNTSRSYFHYKNGPWDKYVIDLVKMFKHAEDEVSKRRHSELDFFVDELKK